MTGMRAGSATTNSPTRYYIMNHESRQRKPSSAPAYVHLDVNVAFVAKTHLDAYSECLHETPELVPDAARRAAAVGRVADAIGTALAARIYESAPSLTSPLTFERLADLEPRLRLLERDTRALAAAIRADPSRCPDDAWDGVRRRLLQIVGWRRVAAEPVGPVAEEVLRGCGAYDLALTHLSALVPARRPALRA
jgi:hypothetical protein